ncbi:phage replisome organizer N-terminal domain-containing protein [Sulfobacillus harzensis]|uniref:Phage replisome organiser N-terminal domain-containing protein n=1 Tax=Sulfobacillus harzensis TaxID=2729629 RepID=A0A7Y0L5R6_9FIRM|nr:phage replisome organizer N-terminal domain-containing protein [Sulfobacillus harzensis]NMP23802.1 hypothetical protein [Sulfobacillus harzensis]
MEWFRFYSDTISNPKIRRLPVTSRWIWVSVLALANASPERGTLQIEAGLPYSTEDIADAAKVSEAEVEQALATFVEQSMLTLMPEGYYRVTGWDKRQFESDDSTARSRKSRAKQGDSRRNDDATSLQRPNVVAATPPETDTDSEKEERENPAPTRGWGRGIPAPTAELLSTLDARANHTPILTAYTDDLIRWHVQGMDWAVIDRGLTLVLERDKPFAYGLTMLKNWFQEGKRTLDDFVGKPNTRAARASPREPTPLPAHSLKNDPNAGRWRKAHGG